MAVTVENKQIGEYDFTQPVYFMIQVYKDGRTILCEQLEHPLPYQRRSAVESRMKHIPGNAAYKYQVRSFQPGDDTELVDCFNRSVRFTTFEGGLHMTITPHHKIIMTQQR